MPTRQSKILFTDIFAVLCFTLLFNCGEEETPVKELVKDGYSCSLNEECQSGFCVDNICTPDSDNDGYPSGEGKYSGRDCDDNNLDINPGAPEVCNNIDDDCNPGAPDGSGETPPLNSKQQGVCAGSTMSCIGSWQDDYSGIPNYEETEVSCDDLDNDCDEQIDEGVKNTYYRDFDGDGYGNPSSTILACSTPAGYVEDNTDCNDNDETIYPGASDLCNNIDDDCNPATQDGSGEIPSLNTKQQGVCAGSVKSCTGGGWQDDYSGVSNYEAAEISCDGLDNDCDGQIDEGVKNTYYRNFDGDGYGNPSSTTLACSTPAGYVEDNTDCDDNNINKNPGGSEYPHCDGLDNNCDGKIDNGCWLIEIVDSSLGGEQDTSIILDSNDNPRISYYNLNDPYCLKYASFNGSSWDIEIVEGDGLNSSLALDSNDNPRISYYDANKDCHCLKYASFNGSSWDIEKVDAPGPVVEVGEYVGVSSSLALDINGYPQISYYEYIDKNSNLKYASFNGSSWDIEIVDGAGNDSKCGTFLALNVNGYPQISYYEHIDANNGNLKYASFNGSIWNIETLDTLGGGQPYPSLALDSNDNPKISYKANGVLKNVSFNGSSWDIEIVDDATGCCTSLTLDGNDNPRISVGGSSLKYAEWKP